MNIDTIDFYSLNIPFKVEFTHSSASRDATETIWVEAKGNNEMGYGESCPRSYVTGESLISARQFYEVIKTRLLNEIHNINDLVQWVEAESNFIDKNPAAWCAVELALLDLLAKCEQSSVEKILGFPELEGTFQYSAVLGDSELDAYKSQLGKYLALGFSDYKIKLSGDLEKDLAKLSCFNTANKNAVRIRLDANNLWKSPADAIAYLQSLNYPVWAIEEPIVAGNYAGLSEIATTLNIRIILDESFSRIDQIELLTNKPDIWIINLRVSKMGGLLRSKEILKSTMNKDIGLIIGAQVGETSLLTRAALAAAQLSKKNLLAQEGAFGTYLLSDDIVEFPLIFGNEGRLDIEKLDLHLNHGFGLSTKPMNEYLERI